MIEKIINCYDSHTHFWATGQVALGLKLNSLKCASDVGAIEIKKNHYRADWIVGFGWDQNHWSDNGFASKFPSKKILDEVFGETPVFLSRVDGHASWINTAAILTLKKLGYDFSINPKGGVIERDSMGEPSGILLDQAHINALIRLPDFSVSQNQLFLETSQKIFNQAGFTHIRDMSMNLSLWQLLKNMEDKKDLTLCIDAFITLESLSDLERVLKEIDYIKKEPTLQSQQLRLQGTKIFIDGSLGARTAYLSQNYLHIDSQGILIWAGEEIKEVLRKSWKQGLQVAIHTIGDQAAHIAVKAAREVSAEGILGRLHLEHVQILRPETVFMMKPLHIVCHMQPCHWLSDSPWLKQTIAEDLIQNLFQWELLRKNKIPLYFGSDSPIEPPSLFNNKKALQESVKWGVPKLNADWKLFHSYPDAQNAQYSDAQNAQYPDAPNTPELKCYTEIEIENEDGVIRQVYFNNKALL